jgi:glycosyltransferase involved in cell wall biosynthesis
MRIVVVNWQDRENPQAGGAETHLHEIFGRLVQYGHDVSLVCAGWRGAPSRAELDGIQVYRVGTRHTYPLYARQHYESLFPRGSHDVVVEDLNKIPLGTPRWHAPKVVGLVHHLFGLTAFRELAAPLAGAVWLAERPLPLIYKNVPFQAVSESTAADLAARGIKRDNVTVIFQGVDTEWYTPCDTERTPQPRFAYLGRLKKYKGVHLVIRAFARLRERYPAATLDIAGAGDYLPNLERLTSSLDLAGSVRFLGRVSEREKLALLRRSWALTFASPKEGWGITNLEAAACGTPVVASNSPGIRESVIDGKTGYLVPHGDVDALAEALGRFAGEPGRVRTMGAAGRRFAETFTWDRAATETETHLTSVLNHATHGG